MSTFITNNPEFPDALSRMLEQDPLISVSGQPMQIFGAEGKDFFFYDCEVVIAMPLFVISAIMKQVLRPGHPQVPEEFLGTYPVITGFSKTFDEYIFAIRPALNLQITHVKG